MTWTDIIEAPLVGLMVLNAVVSIAIVRSDGLTGRQKVMQILIVWLVPVLGGLFLGMFIWTQRGSAPATGYVSTADQAASQAYDAIDASPPSRESH